MKRISTLSFSMALTTDYSLPYLHLLFKQHYKQFGQRNEDYEWIGPKYYTQDIHPDEVVDWLVTQQIDIVFASMYMWNHEYTNLILKLFKERKPDVVVIVGGPHVFADDTTYFKLHPWTDIACDAKVYGEAFMVDYLDGNPLEDVVGAIWPTGKSTKPFIIRDFKWATGVFADNIDYIKETLSELHKNRPRAEMAVTIETSRGCPFACTFCEWGGGIATKMNKKDIDDVIKDVSHLVKAKISTLHIADSNFGFWEDDLRLLRHIASCNRIFGYPKQTVIYGWSKNNNKRHYEMCKIIANSNIEGFYYGLSVQGLNELTMKQIKRSDNPFEERYQLALQIQNELNIDVRLELVMGLPGDTIKDYYEVLDKKRDLYAFTSYMWILLPNTEAYTLEYRQKYGIKTEWANNVQPAFIKPPGTPINREFNDWYNTTNRYEYVIGSNTLDPEEWLEIYVMERFFNTAKLMPEIWKQLESKRVELNLPVSIFWKRFMRNLDNITNPDWIELWAKAWPEIHKLIEPLPLGGVRFIGSAIIEGTQIHISDIIGEFFKLNTHEILQLIETDKRGLE